MSYVTRWDLFLEAVGKTLYFPRTLNSILALFDLQADSDYNMSYPFVPR